MAWTVWGDTYNASADYNNGTKEQAVKFNKNVILTCVRTWVIFYNDPVFTDMTLQIYAYNAGIRGKLLHTSTTNHLNAALISENNGIKDIYFEFPEISLNKDNYYYFVLKGTGAAFTSSSYLAWKHAYPDPVYTTGLSATYPSIGYMPYDMVFIGAEF